jgi:16S rRNA (uracil1498-N3)-methyltransferase
VNSVFFYSEEFKERLILVSSSLRIEYLRLTHNLKVGESRSCGIEGYGSTVFIPTVVDSSIIKGEICQSPPKVFTRVPITLAVSICRPQSVKKLVQLVASLGLEGINFFVGDKTELSYLQSKSLLRDNLELESIKALEQTGDHEIPDFAVYRSLKSLLDSETSDATLTKVLTASVESKLTLKSLTKGNSEGSRYVLVIGSEKGLSEKEYQYLEEVNAFNFSLGERILRVEMAASCAVAQLLLFLSV